MGYETANPTAVRKSSCRNGQVFGVFRADIRVKTSSIIHPFITADKLKEANKS